MSRILPPEKISTQNVVILPHVHNTVDITTGAFVDARIGESNVTQHQAALAVTESQISDLSHVDANAIHANVAAEISVITEKVTPISADLIVVEDSADANNKKRVQLGNVIGSIIPVIAQTRTIAKSGGDFTTFASAFAWADVNASTSNRVVLLAYPGDYTESNPLTIPAFTTLQCLGTHEVTRILCSNPGSNGIVHEASTTIIGLQIQNASTAGSAAFYVPPGIGNVEWVGCKEEDCDIGWLSETNTSHPNILCRAPSVKKGTSTSIFKAINGGTINIVEAFLSNPAIITQAFHVDGAGSTINVVSSHVHGISGSTSVLVINGGLAIATASHFRGLATGLKAGTGGGTIRAIATSIENCTTGVSAGISGIIHCDAVRASGSVTDIETTAASAIVTWAGGCVNTTKISRTAGSTITAHYLEGFLGDEGTTILGELHVGSVDAPSETVLGEGDSSVIDMVVKTTDVSGVGGYIDQTSNATDGISFLAFQGTGAGHRILIGNTSRKFSGWKDSIEIATTLGAGSFSVEMSDGASGWNIVNTMTTDSVFPYNQHSDEIFERAQSSQVRMDITGSAYSSWAKDTIDGVNAYWVNVEIASGITTSPTIGDGGKATIKLHTNRTEFNTDGFLEFFGLAEPQRNIGVDFGMTQELSGFVPKDEDVNLATGIDLKLTKNEFQDNTLDGFGQILVIPRGVDTSKPATISVSWFPMTANAGDVELQFLISSGLTVGDSINTGAGTVTTILEVITVGAATQDDMYTTIFTVPLAGFTPGDLTGYALRRDAQVGNAADTLVGNIAIANIQGTAYFWE